MNKVNPIDRATAELKLEDISISDELRQDMELHNTGKISEQEFLTKAIKRATNNESSLSISRN